jgi:hypothetical protein
MTGWFPEESTYPRALPRDPPMMIEGSPYIFKIPSTAMSLPAINPSDSLRILQ